ncbi:pilus assembly protein TadC [Jannaschia pagri]|uniref:Pilus assembly protein TadC n=1 Tax=Jannaschia pagri TaxID=2829797 RepID=A0ABQ4NIF7_9RHOB|nr:MULTISPECIES: type II secretion system F family protein [unclassified Jannaschia]GIT89919.1 pilus assembly protein TadC [Jannaschia sp. AI_61]GIT93974.1 pilus assembly protein TadC [Jannaschia sp. AI_62]
MDVLQTIIEGALGPDGMIYLAGAAGAILVLLTLPAVLTKKVDPLDRIAEERKAAAIADLGEERLSRHGKRNEHLAKYAKYLETDDKEELSKTRLMLTRAGYAHKDAARTLVAAQLLLGLGLMVLGAIYTFFLLGLGGGLNSALYILGPGVAGYYAPKYWIQKRIAKRQEEIQDGFPDALDLLLVCVEAGQSLDQSIIRMATEIEPSYPSLAAEFLMVAQEMKAGKDKPDVLRAMAERCDLNDITSFVTVLIQSASFGTSIADALRVYAAEMRDKRVMRAEEKANVLPTKLTVGTMMFCVPPLLIILIGPSLHGIASTLSGTSTAF